MDESEKYKCPRRNESFFGPSDTGSDTPDEWHIRPSKPDGAVGAGKRACSYCGSMHPNDLFTAIDAGEKVGPTDKNYKVYVGKHKFYFPHFSSEQQIQFVKLINGHKLNIDYPGHFYVLPFFCKIKGRHDLSD